MPRKWSLYLFDPEDSRWRRPWKEMLPGGFQEVSLEGARFRHPGGDARDGVVVAHASRLPGDQAQARLFDDAGAANLYLVLVSGGLQKGSTSEGRVYRRRRPVRIREVDEEFRGCFVRFWSHLEESGEVRFELLEPAGGMTHSLALLCQGYLLAHIESGTTRIAFPDAPNEVSAQATDAVRRLGVREPAAAGDDPAPAWTDAVRQPVWWSPIDVQLARHELETVKALEPQLVELLDQIAAGGEIRPPAVVAAYLALERHLRSVLRP